MPGMSDAQAEVDTLALPPGAIVGRRGGTIVPIRSSERARELALKRWEMVSAAARRGIAKAGQQIDGLTSNYKLDGRVTAPDVVGYLAEQHTLNAADPSAPGSVQSFREVMRIAYPAPSARADNDQAAPAGGLQINLSPELARELLAELRARRG